MGPCIATFALQWVGAVSEEDDQDGYQKSKQAKVWEYLRRSTPIPELWSDFYLSFHDPVSRASSAEEKQQEISAFTTASSRVGGGAGMACLDGKPCTYHVTQ